MSRVIITEQALKGLEQCRLFLSEKDPRVAMRAAQCIREEFNLLESYPQMGRPFDNTHIELRELVIPFGDSGYVALYHFDPKVDTVFILAFRHQKEVGYEVELCS